MVPGHLHAAEPDQGAFNGPATPELVNNLDTYSTLPDIQSSVGDSSSVSVMFLDLIAAVRGDFVLQCPSLVGVFLTLAPRGAPSILCGPVGRPNSLQARYRFRPSMIWSTLMMSFGGKFCMRLFKPQ
jgi:hypothetical protein